LPQINEYPEKMKGTIFQQNLADVRLSERPKLAIYQKKFEKGDYHLGSTGMGESDEKAW
jgi:hypothetical protein